MRRHKLRALVYSHITPRGWDKERPSPVTLALLVLILLSVVLFTLETEESLAAEFGTAFMIANIVISVLFAIEYVLRVWTCVENTAYAGKWGRVKFVFSWMAVVDLIAFLPSLIFVGELNAFWLRILRIFRILRLLKLGRYSQSVTIVIGSLKKSWRELTVTLGASLFFLYLSAVLLYFVEGEEQPNAFGSIPRAVWWATATLTTVGYGDVYPITALGKFCAGIIALIGVAIVALPAGILAGGFIEEYKARRQDREK